eukprot:110545-Pleurochrysis_carterae.AAC.1
MFSSARVRTRFQWDPGTRAQTLPEQLTVGWTLNDLRSTSALIRWPVESVPALHPCPAPSWTCVAQSAELARRKLATGGRTGEAIALVGLLRQLQLSSKALRRPAAALNLLVALTHAMSRGQIADATGLGLRSEQRTRGDGAALPLRAHSTALDPRPPEPRPSGALGERGTQETAHTAAHAAATRAAAFGSKAPPLSEQELVREILFVMQDIDGAHLCAARRSPLHAKMHPCIESATVRPEPV